jgi:hypothetical protein
MFHILNSGVLEYLQLRRKKSCVGSFGIAGTSQKETSPHLLHPSLSDVDSAVECPDANFALKAEEAMFGGGRTASNQLRTILGVDVW